jgi:hypothetical protein
MSIDIFSLRAIANIGRSLKAWKKKLERGLDDLETDEDLGVEDTAWKLRFLGYVNQQYIRKSVRGKEQAVKAYDRIIKQIPAVIEKSLKDPDLPPVLRRAG